MGEAKRHQKRSLGFGKIDIKISIRKSNHTNNYLVMLNEVTVDSTIHHEEAIAIQKWIKKELTLNPLEGCQLTEKGINKWITSSKRLKDYPETTCEVIVFDTKTGNVKKEQLTVTGDDIIKTAHLFK